MDSVTTNLEPTDAAAAENMALVALTPAEMPDQQRALAEWCGRKVDAVQRELATFRQLEDEAKVGGFRQATFTTLVRRAEKRIDYYKKIRMAVEHGYLIVPNMPIDLFAVRVQRKTPPKQESSYRSGFAAQAEALPAGAGRYVDETLFHDTVQIPATTHDNKPTTKTQYFSTNYDEDVDFPLRGVHPRVLQATGRAMALKLFDELGVVQNRARGRDPIVVGRLLDPRGGGRVSTFFVAWWLNTADL
jgi:hypothetical protein